MSLEKKLRRNEKKVAKKLIRDLNERLKDKGTDLDTVMVDALNQVQELLAGFSKKIEERGLSVTLKENEKGSEEGQI